MTRTSLTGWGRTNASVADVVEVTDDSIVSAIATVGGRGALARGLGRSYGDAAQNGGGTVLRLRSASAAMVLDEAAGTLRVGAGTSLDEVMRQIVPRGWFVPVTPGTRFVTVGGAIASDIHGKNHHVDGSFGSHVARLSLLLADGRVVEVSPTQDAELFWATVGGMGLTGVVLDATIRLLPIETSRMTVDTTRVPDLETLFATMSDGDDQYRYSVAWIDLLATGAHLGRSVLTRGDHARLAELRGRDLGDPFAFAPRQLVDVPPVVPAPGVLNHATVAAFNEFWFRRAPSRRIGEIQHLAAFFHPLDMVGNWNRLYGRRGLVQYQFVVPFGAEDTMRRIVERLSASGVASFLAVLKRFGAASEAPLSFPQPGWTLALDMPTAAAGRGGLLHTLDELVLDAGGRIYFAKDAHTTPDTIRRGYPRLAEWLRVRERVDPHGRWQSDLGRRLQLTAAASPAR